jgi:hypothetical protein
MAILGDQGLCLELDRTVLFHENLHTQTALLLVPVVVQKYDIRPYSTHPANESTGSVATTSYRYSRSASQYKGHLLKQHYSTSTRVTTAALLYYR